MSTLGIFVKQPITGNVKTRLGAEIGNEQAAELYAAFQMDLFERLQYIGEQRVLAYTPATNNAEKFFRSCTVNHYDLWQQPNADLGERLQQFFAEHLSMGFPVVVIGSDSPSLPVNYIEQAFESLTQNDVVLGPAVDGGYYLVGQRVSVPQMFEEIDWSGPHVLQQTVEQVQRNGASLGLLPPWYDIDSLDDLIFLHGHLNGLESAGRTNEIPRRTQSLVEKILNEI